MKNTVFWSWNDAISELGVIEQLKSFAKHGIEGVFVHARDGLSIEYMGEWWMKMFELTVLQASELNIDVWIYDEMGWPSGEANGQIIRLGNEYKAKKLKCAQAYDASFKKRLIGCYKKKEQGYRLVAFCEDADLYIYYDLAEESDKMYEKTGEKFLELVYEQYRKKFEKYFGKEIKGVFFDESAINLFWPTLEYAWSLSLPAKFRELHGYDIKSKLWKLFVEEGEINAFLNDYHLATTELFFENFVQKIQRWCKEHNLLLTGHFCMEESLHTSCRISGSVMRNYKELDVPGIDLLGRRITNPALYKQLSSVLRQFGKKEALCELFGLAGWDADCNQLLWTWKQNALHGITMPCLHLAAYSMRAQRKYDHPGFYSWQQPWWDCSNVFFDKMKEYGEFFDGGVFHNDALVLSPLLSFSGLKYEGKLSQSIANGFRLLLEELSDLQIPYDIGDETLMRDYAHVDGDKITVGNCTYSIVIIPKCLSITESTLALLQAFTDNGGKLFFIEDYPSLVNFRENETLRRYQTVWAEGENGLITFAKKRTLLKAFQTLRYFAPVTVCDRYDGHISSDVEIGYCDLEEERRIMIFNKSTDSFKKARLNVRDFYSLFKPSGEELPVVCNSDGLTVEIELAPTQCLAFVAKKTKTQRKKEITQTVRFDLFPKSVYTELLNTFVIDRVAVTVDGERKPPEYFGKLQFVSYAKTLEVEYGFTMKDLSPEIYILCESSHCVQVFVNGVPIKEKGLGAMIDKSLIQYDITALQREGENKVVITYDERIGKETFITPLLVYGKFDVKTELIAEYATYYKTKPVFTLCKETEKTADEELVKQNLWFYQGPITYAYDLPRQEGKTTLSFEDVACMAMKIFVNDKEVCSVVEFYEEFDITQFLTEEQNKVEIVVYAGLRNVFGPHHHGAGVPNAVGYDSFYGKIAFSDIIWYKYLDETNVYTPDYHFRKVYLGGVTVKNEKEIYGYDK